MQQHVYGNEMTADEAASFLGIEVKGLSALLERYGVGRHYEPRPGADDSVYDREDIEKVKRDLEATNTGTPP